MEAIELAFDEYALIADWKTACAAVEKTMDPEERDRKRRKNQPLLPAPDQNPLLMRMTPQDYLADAFTRIPLSELENCLSLLSFTNVMQFMSFCMLWLESHSIHVELICRAVFYLIRLHLKELSQAKKHRDLLLKLQAQCRTQLQAFKEVIAFNCAGNLHMQRQLQADESASEFFEAANIIRETKAKKREKEKTRKLVY
jgi:U3 small nucleolar RNA-associated protein 12